MMKQPLNSKEDVQKAFQSLLAAYERNRNKIATKEEQAAEEANAKLVEAVAEYTPQSIVKGLADLRLDFSNTIETLVGQMATELEKLSNLQGALNVQKENLDKNTNTKIAANALYILKQEQAQREAQLNEEHKEALERLEEDIKETREEWAREDAEFVAGEEEYKAGLEKSRIKEEEEYKYQLERKHVLDKDKYDNEKRMLVRQLEEEQQQKDKDWSGREKVLSEHQEDFDKYKTKVDGFEDALNTKTKEAREKAMKQAQKENNESMELLQKEVETKAQVSQLEIEYLDKTLTEQKAESERLTLELKEAQAKVQELSLKALEGGK